MDSIFRVLFKTRITLLKNLIARIFFATDTDNLSPTSSVDNAEKTSPSSKEQDTEFAELVTHYIADEMSPAYGIDLATDEEQNFAAFVPEYFSVFSRFFNPVEEDAGEKLVAENLPIETEIAEVQAKPEPSAIETEKSQEVIETPVWAFTQLPLITKSMNSYPVVETPTPPEFLEEEQVKENNGIVEDRAEDTHHELDDESISEMAGFEATYEEAYPKDANDVPILDTALVAVPNEQTNPIPDSLSTNDYLRFDAVSSDIVDVPADKATRTWYLREEMKFQFDEHEPEIAQKDELEHFLDQLATGGIQASVSINEIEQLLRLAFRRIEYVGELPVSREAFEQLNAIIRGRFAPGGRRPSLREANCPALFVTTMVFCARYSDEDARSFWRPYAQKVWHLRDTDQSFQVMCSSFFFKSRLYLEDRYAFQFPLINRGDVVRPLYRHAILPYYLQADFAEWLIRNLRVMQQEIPLEHLPSELAETKLEYVSKSLRQFIRAEETRDTAYSMIQQMKRAIDLFAQEGDTEAVRKELSSPIERELWDQIAQALSETAERRIGMRQSQTRLEWVWSLEADDLLLRLLNLRVSYDSGKPEVCQWVNDQGIRRATEYLRPWQNEDGWLVDEVLLSVDAPKGRIEVLSEADDTVYECSVPPLPVKPYALFRLTQQRQYGIAVEATEIVGGDWLLSLGAGIEVQNDQGDLISPIEARDPAGILREIASHRSAGVYELHPPIQLLKNGEIVAEWSKKQSAVGQPFIRGDAPLVGVWVSVPPVFQNRDIYLHIPQFNEKSSRVTLSIKVEDRTILTIEPFVLG